MANQYLTVEQKISYWKETTPCVPPADIAADGQAIEFVSLNIDGVVEELIVDNTAEADALDVGNRFRIKGRRNGTFSIVRHLHGLGLITADAQLAPFTPLTELMAAAWGGYHLTKSTTITGGTSTIPIFTSVDTITPGCMVTLEDVTAPALEDDGFPVCRRVLAVDVVTKEVTLSEELGWVPAAGDKVHATATIYTSAHALRESAGETYGWYISLGDDVSMQWRLDGCVHSGSIEGFSLGATPTFTISGLNANYLHGSQEGLSYIDDLGEPDGSPPLTSGLDMTLSIQEVGVTDLNLVEANAITFDAGITRSKGESQTPKTFRFHGLSHYSMNATQSTMSVTLSEYQTDYLVGLSQNKRYRVTLTQQGAGAGAGSGYCVTLPFSHLVTTPGKAAVGDNWGLTLTFEGRGASDAVSPTNRDMARSRFIVALF